MRRILIAIAAVVVVGIAERSLSAHHAHAKSMIVVGLVFGLPFVIASYLMERRRRPAPKPAPRPGYPFGGPR